MFVRNALSECELVDPLVMVANRLERSSRRCSRCTRSSSSHSIRGNRDMRRKGRNEYINTEQQKQVHANSHAADITASVAVAVITSTAAQQGRQRGTGHAQCCTCARAAEGGRVRAARNAIV